MSETKELLRRGVGGFEPTPDAFERVLVRRDRKQRNRRVAAGVLGIAVFALGALAFVRLLGSERTPASDPASPFEGTWVSTSDLDGGTQTMTVVVSADGAVEITVLDTIATVCGGTASTMTGTGRIEDGTALVIPSPMYTCDDGSVPETLGGPPLAQQLRDWTLFPYGETDTLSDGVGGVWGREGAEGTSTPPASGGMWLYSIVDGEVAFAATDPPWHLDADVGSSRTLATLRADFGGISGRTSEAFGGIKVLADPLPVGTGCETDAAPVDAQAWAERILSDPDFEATEPTPIRIAGVGALQMDVAPAPGASICDSGGGLGEPVLFTSAEPHLGPGSGLWRSQVDLWHGNSYRVYLLDVPAGSSRILAVVVSAEPRMFELVIEAAVPILDSFEFHAP